MNNSLINILFLASNPFTTSRLRIDEEFREINEALYSAKFSVKIQLNQCWATRISDLQPSLLRYKPNILHFSGHGSKAGEIILENDFGKESPVSAKAISDLFSLFDDSIRCVLLNACYSEHQGLAIAEHIDCVIGMSDQISDTAAINFATSFYRALGYGENVKKAYDLACNQISLAGLDEEYIPRLISKNVDPTIVNFFEISKKILTIKEKKSITVSGFSPQNILGYFFDREEEQQRIKETLLNTEKKIILILGQGGVGKTALACKVIQDLEENKTGYFSIPKKIRGIAYLSTRSEDGITLRKVFQGIAELLPDSKLELLNVLDDKNITIQNKLSILFSKLKNRNDLYIVLLDNIEDLLDSEGRLKQEEGLGTFLDLLFSVPNNIKIISTSRNIINLTREDSKHNIVEMTMKTGLPVNDSINFIKDIDNESAALKNITDEQLKEAIEYLNGMPLSLKHLISRLKYDPLISLKELIGSFYSDKEGVNLLENFFSNLDKPDLLFILSIAVFKKPVPLNAIEVLLTSFDKKLSKINFRGILSKLYQVNILIANRDTKLINLHPLEQEYAYKLLTHHPEYSKNKFEECAAQYYKSARQPKEKCKNIDDLSYQCNEFEHLINAENYIEAAKLLEEIENDYLIKWGDCLAIKGMREVLLPNISGMDGIKNITLTRLGESCLEIGLVEEGVNNLKESFKLSLKTGNRILELSNLIDLGITYYSIGNFSDSIKHLTKAHDLYNTYSSAFNTSDIALKKYGSCLNWLGIYFRSHHNFEKAMLYHNQALEFAKNIHDIRLEAHVNANIGAVYLWKKEFNRVVEYWKLSLKLSKDINDKIWIAHYLIDVGYMYFLLRDFENAITYLEEGTKVAQKNHYEGNIARGFMNQANTLFALNKLEESKKMYLQALDIAKESSKSGIIWRIEHNIGNIYKKQGLKEKAYECYKLSIDYLEKIMNTYESSEEKEGFLKHRLDPFRSMVLLLLEQNEEDLAMQYSDTFGYGLLFVFLQNRIKNHNIQIEEENNLNFFDGYYIITE